MIIHKIWNLIARKLSGEASEEELMELGRQMEDDSKLFYEMKMIEYLWEKDVDEAEDRDYLEATYILHQDRMRKMGVELHGQEDADENRLSVSQSNVKRRVFRWTGLLVLLALVWGIGFLMMGETRSAESSLADSTLPNQVELKTKKGVKSKFMLPDGSMVWLNAGSILTYGKDFGREKREVILTGEGFFDVQKNTEKPFIISTSSVQIKVLGTAFNVKAYPEDRNTETSLIRGSIELTIKSRPNDKIILSPNEKIIVENNPPPRSEKKTQIDNHPTSLAANTLISIKKLKINPLDSSVLETQWVENKLVFRDESFRDIALKMERWYDVQIEIQDELLADERLSGIFTSETVTEALDALKESMSVPFRFKLSDRKINIYR